VSKIPLNINMKKTMGVQNSQNSTFNGCPKLLQNSKTLKILKISSPLLGRTTSALAGTIFQPEMMGKSFS